MTVAIVGGGPAGCAAALALGKAGLEAVVLEKGRPGKDKPCGDAFVRGAVAELEGLGCGPEELKALGGRPYSHVCWDGEERESDGGWLVPRAALDQWLRDRVNVRYERKVASVKGLEVDGELFDAVILAEGGGAPLARSLGLDGVPYPATAISGYTACEKEPRLEFLREEDGYAWDFGVNAGVMLSGMRRRETAARFAQAAPKAAPRGGLIPLWSGLGFRWHHDAGVVSCGDAAALVDPETGEGLTAALLSGRVAGERVAAFLKDGAPLSGYSDWVRAYFTLRYSRDRASSSARAAK